VPSQQNRIKLKDTSEALKVLEKDVSERLIGLEADVCRHVDAATASVSGSPVHRVEIGSAVCVCECVWGADVAVPV
jgi:hypothetical protein